MYRGQGRGGERAVAVRIVAVADRAVLIKEVCAEFHVLYHAPCGGEDERCERCKYQFHGAFLLFLTQHSEAL